MRAKWFCCAIKLGFVQLRWKVSLIFKSNLELALSVILNERESYKSKHVVVDWIYILGEISNHQELGLYMKNNF